jgi:hypothetical protein
MAKVKVIALKEHEYIVAVVPEYCHGPGWSNALTVVHIVNSVTSQHRCEYIQPEERSADMHTLFRAGEAMHGALVAAVPKKTTRSARLEVPNA